MQFWYLLGKNFNSVNLFDLSRIPLIESLLQKFPFYKMKPPKTDPPHLQPNWEMLESWNFAWTVTWLIQTTMPRRFLILFPRAELRGWSAVTPGGEKWAVHPHSSALGWNLENRLGIVVCINQETIHAKFQLSTILQLGCRWGRSVLGGLHFLNWELLYLMI